MPSGSSISTSPPVSPANAALPSSLQPFQCTVCLRRFTRHENLKRHSTLHQSSRNAAELQCAFCPKVFARQDLRKRHIKKQHEGRAGPSRSRTAEKCREAEQSRRSESVQFELLFNQGLEATAGRGKSVDNDVIHVDPISVSPAPGVDSVSSSSTSEVLSSMSMPQDMHYLAPLSNQPGLLGDLTRSTVLAQQPTYVKHVKDPSLSPVLPVLPLPPLSIDPTVVTEGIDLYFRFVSPSLPFLHQPTFNIASLPECLLMAILSLGLRFADSPGSEDLASQCFFRGRRILEFNEQSGETVWGVANLSIIQAYLLLELHAHLCAGGSGGAYGLRLHSKLIELVRRGGLTDPLPAQAANAGDLDALWRQFVRTESHKRTLYAAHIIDVLWYHTLSLQRTLSHLEIKHDLPSSVELWEASTATEWAHRTLVKDQSKTSTRYLAAVRSCLAPSPLFEMSTFDAHGCLMVLLFLLSSAREISGWSTMTGRICLERVEALHSALLAFEPIVEFLAAPTPMAILMQATWHITMLELLLWSPSHTNGVVEHSLEAALAASTRLSNTDTLIESAQVAASIEPHLRWFLSHLDSATDTREEAPWVTLFAYKAVLVAWRLVRVGGTEPFTILGVTSADEMLDWMKEVFERRSHWAIGGMIANSLGELEGAT